MNGCFTTGEELRLEAQAVYAYAFLVSSSVEPYGVRASSYVYMGISRSGGEWGKQHTTDLAIIGKWDFPCGRLLRLTGGVHVVAPGDWLRGRGEDHMNR